MNRLVPVLGDPFAFGRIGGSGALGGGTTGEQDGTLTVVLPLVTSTQTIFEFAVVPDTTQIVSMNLVTSTQTIFNPTVTPGSVSVVLPLVSSSQTIFDLTVSGPATTAAVQLETGDLLLLETGDKWLVESGAAAKITAMTNNTSPVGTDLVLMVDDPSGTEESQKMTLTTLRTYLLG